MEDSAASATGNITVHSRARVTLLVLWKAPQFIRSITTVLLYSSRNLQRGGSQAHCLGACVWRQRKLL
ncbi:hypothetical protein NDU88_002828 [Pleurodeles waltl]|uniref:Uncharacterized protein n=1 Tax=Pleurodeles waltl TaxID=8319 RepID=A0AAV7T4S4_PLEWA|nr:hypothetical protein NDU88_002828 [Pleurodeles waltl]